MDTSVVSHQNKEQKLFTASVRTLLSTYILGTLGFQSRVAAKTESKPEPTKPIKAATELSDALIQ